MKDKVIVSNILNELTLLYVEDESATREHLMFYLEDNFKHIIIAVDGKEGLELFKKNLSSIDIIISDIQMPKMDGLKMIYEIKKLNQKIPCILTTAYNDSEYLLEAIELGVLSYLIKPINIDTLFDKINSSIHTSLEKEYISILLEKLKTIDKLNINNFLTVLDKTVEELSQIKIVDLHESFKYDYANKLIVKNDENILLTKQEILIIEYLLKNRNHIVTYDSLINLISPNYPSIDTLRTNIKSIRGKTDKKFIKNLSGVGYKIDEI